MERNKDITRESYDRTAWEYYEKVSAFEDLPYMQLFINSLEKHGKVLDLGCGPGIHSKVFSETGLEVIGIDLSEKMIDLAKKVAPKATFHVMDIEDLSFDNSIFDGIWASASLLHVAKKNISKVLMDLYRIMKPKGLLYLSLKIGSGEGLEIDDRYSNVEKFYNYFSPDEIHRYISKTKFTSKLSQEIPKRSDYDAHSWIHLILEK